MTTVDVATKPNRKPTSHRAVQLRLERYAATGPNCPSGHSWATHAKFDRGYRHCTARMRTKAEQRRNDPMTYTGACRHGHAFTRENTMITCKNSKVCIACLRKPDARLRSMKPGKMEEILKRARRGDTVNEIFEEDGPAHRRKGIISRVRLLAACQGTSPEAVELSALLKQNARAAVGNGRPLFWWSYDSIALLSTEYKNGSEPQQIADLINTNSAEISRFERSTPKRISLGSWCRASRILVPKLPKLPPLTAALRFPIGGLLYRTNAVVPRYLSRDHRDDVIGEMALAVYEGRLAEADIARRTHEFVRAGYRSDHDPWGHVSLDAPIPGTDLLRIDTISEGLWG
jgi:hypothetical protein